MNGKLPVGNHFIYIDLIDYAQSFTFRTGPLRRVERKIVRRRLAIRQPCDRTHQAFAVMADAFGLSIQNHQQTVSLSHGSCHALFQTFIILVGYNQFVDYNLDIVILIPVDFHAVRYFTHIPVYTDIQVTLFAYLFEQLFVMSLARTHQWSE